MRRAVWAALLAAVVVALAGCSTGSKTVTPEYFTIDDRWQQLPSGGLVVSGRTDLPDGTQIDVLVSATTSAESAVDRAVLIGSTEGGPGSHPVRDGAFTITVDRVLTNTCGVQPPCGPFPSGKYLLLLDAKTPDVAFTSVTTFDDPRYLATTHGVAGFTGIEIARQITLQPIQLCLDVNGDQRTGGCQAS